MCEGSINRSLGNNLKSQHHVIGGKPEDHEALPDVIGKKRPVEGVDIPRSADDDFLFQGDYVRKLFGGLLEPLDDGSCTPQPRL
jgi:hypothetical protein